MGVRVTEIIEDRVRSWHREGLLVEHYLYAPGAVGEMTLHTHADYQICISQNAPGEYRYRGNRMAVPARSVSIIHPHELHGARDLEKRASHAEFWVFYINPEFVQRLFGLKHAPFAERAVSASREIFSRFAALPGALLGSAAKVGRNGHVERSVQLNQSARNRRRAQLSSASSLDHGALLDHGSRLGRDALLGQALESFFNISGLRAPVALPRFANAMLERARKILEDDCAANPTLHELAREVGLSPRTFSREFTQRFGTPPHRYLTQARVERAKRLLADGVPIAEAAAASGFADQSHLTRHFRALTGFTPGRYYFGKNVQDVVRERVLEST